MMCDRICNQGYPTFSCRLLHDLSLSDSRCTKKKYRSLMNTRYHILSILIFHKIRFDRIHNFLFCLFNIHNNLLSSLMPVYRNCSVPSQLRVKMHSKSPSVMAFCLVCLGILAKNMPKRLAGYYLLNSYCVSKISLIAHGGTSTSR